MGAGRCKAAVCCPQLVGTCTTLIEKQLVTSSGDCAQVRRTIGVARGIEKLDEWDRITDKQRETLGEISDKGTSALQEEIEKPVCNVQTLVSICMRTRKAMVAVVLGERDTAA